MATKKHNSSSSNPADTVVADAPRQAVNWDGSNCRILAGYGPELIAAGLIKPGQFPGDPGQRKTASRFVNAEGRKCRATTSGRMYRVFIYYTPDEQRASDLRSKKRIARMVEKQGTWSEGARAKLLREIGELESQVAHALSVGWIVSSPAAATATPFDSSAGHDVHTRAGW